MLRKASEGVEMSLLVKEAKIQLLDVPVEPLFDNFRCQIAGGQVVVAVTWPVGHTIRRYTSRRNAEAGREQKVRLVEYVSKALLAATDDQDLADRIEDLLD